MVRPHVPVGQLGDLDEIDFKILRALAGNGRITNLDLSVAVNLSTAPTLRRVRSLEQRGVIKGYAAILDPAKVGLPTIVYVAAILDNQTAAAAATFEEAVRSLPEVLECHHVVGQYSYLLKVKCASTRELEELLARGIKSAEGVAQTMTIVALSTSKEETAIPVSAGAALAGAGRH